MQTQPYQEKLETERDELITSLQELGVQNPDVPEDWVTAQTLSPEPDPNDVADHTEAFNEQRATLATLETRYNNIMRALQKISDGTYGTCTVCNEPIPEDRLTANPAATTCIAHADNSQ